MKYILSIDQGTTSTRAILFDSTMVPVATASRVFSQLYPRPGWVEHNPDQILSSVLDVVKSVVGQSGINRTDLSCIGITNQRETVVVWDRKTGKPVYNAIVWQCRRTSDRCESLMCSSDLIRSKTGLVPDAYFSGSKIEWILHHVKEAREKAQKGELMAGTIDTFLIWHITGGKVFATDYSNASRTMLFNIHTLDWDEDLLEEFGIPRQMLPEVKPTSGIFGMTDPAVCGFAVPVTSAVGDQQAALFGQTCFEKGDTKNTYGTGCFMLMNTGEVPVFSKKGLLTTIAWGLNGKVTYALEGSVFVAGAAIQWLRDELGLIKTARECDELAETVPDAGGAYFVPAFVGLGTPYWDMYARGTITGLTRGTSKAHIARAALEAIAYQTCDVLRCMQEEAGCCIRQLKVDGGASVSNILMQFQAGLLGVPVVRPKIVETTAMGVAYLAGLAAGLWKGLGEIADIWQTDRIFQPDIQPEKADQLCKGWAKAVKRSLDWAKT